MKKILVAVAFATLSLCGVEHAHAQATGATANSIACPASGTSIQVLAAKASRESYLITNTAGVTVRIGFLATGTATLDDTNSILVLAGQTFGDSAPSIYIGRVVCMSNDATPRTIYVIQTSRP